MAYPLLLGRLIFNNYKEVIHHIQLLIRKYDKWITPDIFLVRLDENDSGFIKDVLLNLHPKHWNSVYMGGIYYGHMSANGSNYFHLDYRNYKAKLRFDVCFMTLPHYLRSLIRNQIILYKNSISRLNPWIICPDCRKILPTMSATVDHVKPLTFNRVATEWLEMQGITSISQLCNDTALKHEWMSYHFRTTGNHLQLVCSECNLSRDLKN